MHVRQRKTRLETKVSSAEDTAGRGDRSAAATHSPAWTAAWRDRPLATLFTPHVAAQAKLTVSQPGDAYEQEAEHVAAQVMPATAMDASSHDRARGAAKSNEPLGDATWTAREGVNSAGQPLDMHTRALFETRLGADFGHVRIHTNPQASESAGALGSLAYTVGSDIVFGANRYAPHSAAGQHLLAHELTHVIQQHQAAPAVMRAAAPDVTQPRTFIIVYGSGQVNPSTNQHNVGDLFRMVASQKLAEIKARLGKQASQHTFVFEYAPTEAELKNVLNKKYAAPIAEVHIFSHGWEEGANLGGPIPPDLKNRPTETPDEAQQRRLTKEDLGSYDIAFASDAVVVFYGCNIGNAAQADENRPFAQEFSEAFGVTVTASTRSTHFENKGGWHQVPDVGGKMVDYTPTPETIRAEANRYQDTLKKLNAKKVELATPVKKGGLIGVMIREDRLRSEIDTLQAEVDKKRPLIYRLLRFLPESERATLLKSIQQAEAPVQAGATSK